MTIKEAIKIKEDQLAEIDCNKSPKLWVATHLSIEALKREKVWRQNDPGGAIHLLPGETGVVTKRSKKWKDVLT